MAVLQRCFITITCLVAQTLADALFAAGRIQFYSNYYNGARYGDSQNGPRKIAIIGAGIAGASAAHQLHERTREVYPLNVTVFEKDDHIGGQLKSTTLREKPGTTVETGATAFHKDDWCMVEAMDGVGLQPATARTRGWHTPRKTRGIWNGENFQMLNESADEHPTLLQQFANLFWQYGLERMLQPTEDGATKLGNAKSSFQALRDEVTAKFKSFARFREVKNLQRDLDEAGLGTAISISARDFLSNISSMEDHLVEDLIRPLIRAGTLQDIDDVNGLTALTSLQESKPISAQGGNQRVPHRLLKLSEAKVKLNATVTSIKPGSSRRWQIESQIKTKTEVQNFETNTEEFDYVILTGPLAQIDVDAIESSSALRTAIPESYVERHVTHFTSSRPLSRSFFKMAHDQTLPLEILTAPNADIDDFLISITVEAMVQEANPSDVVAYDEYLYRAITTTAISDDQILSLLGEDPKADMCVGCKHESVDWIHRQAWPFVGPRFTKEPLLENIEVATDFFYTAAGQRAASTMEMSCRMGRIVADELIYSKWAPRISSEDLIP